MKITTTSLALASSLVAFGLVSCAQEPPVYIETPEVHNVTVLEKKAAKPEPKPKPKPRPRPAVKTAESFRAVY